MKKRQFVILRAEQDNQEIDLEMPGDQPINVLMPDLLKLLNWPAMAGQRRLNYSLRTEVGEELDGEKSLDASGIENFEVLWIRLDDNGAPVDADSPGPIDPKNAKGANAPAQAGDPLDKGMIASPDRRGNLKPPFWSKIPIDRPSLVSPRGVIFVLGVPPLVIGRRTSDSRPDIDLSEIDREFVSSRMHAQILSSGGDFILCAFQTRNGTFVNGVALPPGERWKLKDGDTIQVGFRGVQLIFRLPSKKQI